MQKWLTCVDSSPGITQTALDAISEKAALSKKNGEQLYVCLIHDEISIKQQVLSNAKDMSFEGFGEKTSSKTRKKKSEKVPLVKNALVYMIVGPDFRIAVAYKFLDGMNAVDRAAFTKEVIRRVDLTGAKVISLTGDGLHANKTLAELLGANFKAKRPYFPRPSDPTERIYVIFDAPHMMKLLRKYLSEQRLQHGDYEMLWELLKNLAEKQDRDNFSLTKKLTRSHIFWKDHKMNVKKAVQIFSNENAEVV